MKTCCHILFLLGGLCGSLAAADAPVEDVQKQIFRDVLGRLKASSGPADSYLVIYELCEKGEACAALQDIKGAKMFYEAALNRVREPEAQRPGCSLYGYRRYVIVKKLVALDPTYAAPPPAPRPAHVYPY